MKKSLVLLFAFSALGLVGCGGGGGGLSGSPDQPVTVSVSINTTSVTLEEGDTYQFQAGVSNATDTTVTWAVNDVVGGNSTVGTISVDGLYTAPATAPSPNAVTLKVTANADKTKSKTATVTINVKFAISPTAATVGLNQTQQFTANHSVDSWYVDGSLHGSPAAGGISDTGLYTPPASVPNPNTVTVKAIELGNTTKSATAIVTIVIQAVTISPAPVTLPAGATQQFTADAAVNWEVIGASGTDSSTWGTISASGLYIAPLSPPWTGTVTIKATSQSDPTITGSAIATIVFSNASLNGHYAFRYRGIDKAVDAMGDHHIWAVGSFVADGKGGISGGSVDLNEIVSSPGPPSTAPFTGTYSIGPDGRASATLTLQVSGTPAIPLRWVMLSNTAARMVSWDDTGSGWGNIDMQDPSSFSAGLSGGTYVFSYEGLSNGSYPYAAAGMFNADAGVIASGLMNFNFASPGLGVGQTLMVNGSYTTVDPSTGRGTWNYVDYAFGYTWSFAFYLLNSSSFVFSSVGTGVGLLGMAVQQDANPSFSNSSLSGDSVFISTGYVSVNSNTVSVTSAGRFTADGSGNLASGVVDNNGSGNLPASGTYSISSNGSGTLTITAGGSDNPVAIYMITPGQFYYVSLNAAVVSTGQFMPQATGTYSAATLHNSFGVTLRASYVSAGEDLAGQMTSDGAGNLTGTADVNAAGTLQPDTAFTGTYTMSANGRGELAANLGSVTTHFAIYMASERLAFLVPIDSGAPGMLGLAYRQF